MRKTAPPSKGALLFIHSMSPDTSMSVSEAFKQTRKGACMVHHIYIYNRSINTNKSVCMCLLYCALHLYTRSYIVDKYVCILKVDWKIKSGHNTSCRAVVGGKSAVE